MNTQHLEACAKFLGGEPKYYRLTDGTNLYISHDSGYGGLKRLNDAELFYALLGKAAALKLSPDLHGFTSGDWRCVIENIGGEGPTPLEALAEAIRRMQE